MRLLYTIGVSLYGFAIRIAALFHGKARLWVQGRKNWRTQLQQGISAAAEGEWIWFHCASLGEFEQGRNLMEAIRQDHPQYRILLTFFSPSGYEIRKEYAQADFVTYMPLDTRSNAKAFLDLARPKMALFIKYELWVNHLLEMEKRGIPTFLVSAFVTRNSGFFRPPMAQLYRKVLHSFRWIFCQDGDSETLIHHFTGKDNLSISGDTRFDRALSLLDAPRELPQIAAFKGDAFCLIAGSPWPKDEEILLQAWQSLRSLPVKMIIAPHEIHPQQIQQTISQHPEEMIAFSQIDQLKSSHKVLWIDNIGMLSALYRYADLVYIGGGFGKSIHNTQEPAAFGNPVAFGPKYTMFREAVALKELNCAFPVHNADELLSFFQRFYQNPALLAETRSHTSAYMKGQGGATQLVLQKLTQLNCL